MKWIKALISGLIGALTLTLVHQSAKKAIPEAPRVDLIGMRAVAKTMRKADVDVPDRDTLYKVSFADHLISNTLYYSLVGAGNRSGAWLRGMLLGALGGAGAVALPPRLGLGEAEVARTTATQTMTVAWYLIAGVAAAAAYNILDLRMRD